MKSHHLFAVLLVFTACNTPIQDEKADRREAGDPKAPGASAPVLDTANPDTSVHVHERVWIQYKRDPVFDAEDTLPYPHCTIALQGSRFRYSRDKRLVYEDEAYVDTSFRYRVYGFRDHPGDKLMFLDDKGARVVLKRYYYEGDHEYFEQLK